jgi:hypothetical protein
MLRTVLALMLVGVIGCGGASKDAPAPTPTPVPPDPSAKMAPDFTLQDTEGREVKLSELRANGPVILAFFPKAFTGG